MNHAREKVGRKDVFGVDVRVGDEVFCYDQESDGVVTSGLTGLVKIIDGKACVSGNELALTCATHVEIIG